MTAVTPETVSEEAAETRSGTLARRLTSLLVRIQTAVMCCSMQVSPGFAGAARCHCA